MFIEQRKKKNYRTFIYSAIIILLCMLIVVIAWPAVPEKKDDVEVSGQNDVDPFGENSSYMEDNTIDDYSEEESDTEEENNDIMVLSDTYYVVKRAGSQIKVFFVDQHNNEIELETTDIVYDVLGVEDQKLFDEGFVVKTQEELAVLLQDFES